MPLEEGISTVTRSAINKKNNSSPNRQTVLPLRPRQSSAGLRRHASGSVNGLGGDRRWRGTPRRWKRAPRPITPIRFILPAEPVGAKVPATGPGWLHEIKHDGFRLVGWRNSDRVRPLARNGTDFTHRFPLVVEAIPGPQTALYGSGSGRMPRSTSCMRSPTVLPASRMRVMN